jgi:hypothetical protein
MLRLPILLLVPACLALAATPAAQQHVAGRAITIGPAEHHPAPARRLDIPMPPRALLGLDVAADAPLARGGHSRPQPDSPPSTLQLAPPAAAAPCDVVGHASARVRPAGGAIHTVAEPSVALVGTTPADTDTAFYTANLFAGLSLNGGDDWTHINPYTRFPAIDGGFAADQRAFFVPSREITLWHLIYYPDAAKGSIRLAVAVDRAGLRADVWHSYVLYPQLIGFPAGYWYDFPDLVCTDNHLYLTLNIITGQPWTRVDAVLFKMRLDELRSGGALNLVYWTKSELGPAANHRLAQGSSHTMYMAGQIDRSTLRVFRNPDASNVLTFDDRAIAEWTGVSWSYLSTLANGVNWAARCVTFVKGGYANDEEYGFLWHADRRAGRPQPYVRVSRFRTSDHALIGEEDIWSPDFAWLYPAATTNAAGHIACTVAVGGPSLRPVTAVAIVDDCRPSFAGGAFAGFAVGTHDPAYAGWGDYFTMQRHPSRTLTFVTTGQSQQGGSQTSDQEPRFFHFGRARDDLAWTSVIVKSSGVAGVPIATSPVDAQGKSSVTTPGYASYDFAAAFSLTAPATHAAGAKTWEFQRWRHRLTPIDPWVDLPLGQLTLTNGRIGQKDDTAEAIYRERVPASVTPYGTGCPGSNGLAPDHFTDDLPELGRTARYEVRDVFGASSAALFLGFSNTDWNGTPLPFSLGVIGADPSCSVLAPGTLTLPFATDASGRGGVALRITANAANLGVHFYTQAIVVDPGASAPLKVIVSNGLDSTIGGLR